MMKYFREDLNITDHSRCIDYHFLAFCRMIMILEPKSFNYRFKFNIKYGEVANFRKL